MSTAGSVLVLGIGNLLWADEGFGVRVVQHLQGHYRFPEAVRLMDGGTQGLALIPHVQEADTLVIADAVDFGLAPGTLVQAHDEDVPMYLCSGKLSLHQVSFQEVLSLCRLMGRSPARLCLVGVQPAVLEDYGGSLSPQVRAQLQPAAECILVYLAQLGLPAEPGSAGTADPGSLDMAGYEEERPSAERACRQGDARFLNRL